MNVTVFTQHEILWDYNRIACERDRSYSKFAEIAWEKNKKLYCEKHGYQYYVIDSQNKYGNIHCGFIKIIEIYNYFQNNPQVDWVFWIDCDTLITNFTIKLDDILDNNYHVVVAHWFNELNNGVFGIRNSPEGKNYLLKIMENFNSPHHSNEQRIMAAMIHDPKYVRIDGFIDIVKVVPQRVINSGDFTNPKHYPYENSHIDLLGNDGQWQKGDFIIHYPGLDWETRLKLMKYHFGEVIYE